MRVDLTAAFDTYLTVRPPSGPALENDDLGEGNLNSRVDFTAQDSGDYVFDAGAYARTSQGPYRLTVARGHAVPLPPPATGARLTPGAVLQGELAMGDRVLPGGKIADDFQFEGHRGDLINLELHSPVFDTYLTVRSPDGQVWISDDITGADLDSRVQATLAADGHYGVEVSSFRAGVHGGYTVRLDQSPRPSRAVVGTGGNAAGPVANVTGRTGHGRIFGVFVGIREYGGEAADLEHCDEDASELARVLRDRGVQTATQQVVLTNAQATPLAMRSAIEAMARLVSEDDLLMVFYSGHGSQVRGTAGVEEPDGLDETIRLRGGSVRDNDLAAWIAPVRGTVLVALDSCHAGGFARDVVAAPGRIGLFASEEDVLSDVAPRYGAGGFLSYWLRLGLGGEADVNHDGTVRVGELVDYLYAQFGDHRVEMPTSGNGGGATWQHLVVARGSVVNTDLLLRYPE